MNFLVHLYTIYLLQPLPCWRFSSVGFHSGGEAGLSREFITQEFVWSQAVSGCTTDVSDLNVVPRFKNNISFVEVKTWLGVTVKTRKIWKEIWHGFKSLFGRGVKTWEREVLEGIFERKLITLVCTKEEKGWIGLERNLRKLQLERKAIVHERRKWKVWVRAKS